MDKPPFNVFFESLQEVGADAEEPTPGTADPLREGAVRAEQVLRALGTVTRENLASTVAQHPWIVPFLASCVGSGAEQLRRQLRAGLGSAGWIRLARHRSTEVVEFLDNRFGLVRILNEELQKQWSFADILEERVGATRRRASRSQRRGRRLEDEVSRVLCDLRLSHEMRTRFQGREGRHAPCDFAIPAGGDKALIVGAVKGFDSTGSKLSDAVREIQKIADIRLPRQFVFAVVDGIGWLDRKADLGRIYQLWEQNEIDGLYSLASMDRLRADLQDAAQRLRL